MEKCTNVKNNMLLSEDMLLIIITWFDEYGTTEAWRHAAEAYFLIDAQDDNEDWHIKVTRLYFQARGHVDDIESGYWDEMCAREEEEAIEKWIELECSNYNKY